jgi:hypothetical protein
MKTSTPTRIQIQHGPATITDDRCGYYRRLAHWRQQYPNKALQLDLWRDYSRLREAINKDTVKGGRK